MPLQGIHNHPRGTSCDGWQHQAGGMRRQALAWQTPSGAQISMTHHSKHVFFHIPCALQLSLHRHMQCRRSTLPDSLYPDP